ncbi:agmatine deiminase family protein [Tistrella mobilis]|uniref:agmatine deiminase family protein n=1 Tax=Tistrella mobilis TaxID=171437 RepID=UPI00355841BE
MSEISTHPGAPPHPSCHLPAPDQPARLWLAVWPSAADGIRDPRDAGLAIAEAARILARDTRVAMLARAGDLADASMRCGAGVGVSSWEGSLACFADRRPSMGRTADGAPCAVEWPVDRSHHHDDCDVAGRLLALAGDGTVGRVIVDIDGRAGMVAADGGGVLVASDALLGGQEAAREAMAARLAATFGAGQVVWVPGGLADDERPGNLDGVVRFLAPGVVAVAVAAEGDPDHAVLAETRRRLEVVTLADGMPMSVVPVPLPKRRPRDEAGRLLPASYLSLLRDGRRLVVPGFEDGNDAAALKALSRALPTAAIEQVPCPALAPFGGFARLAVALPQPAPTSRADDAGLIETASADDLR